MNQAILIAIIVIVAILFLVILFVLSYVKAGPDTAIMVTGAGKRKF